jgi:hypothetical protein
MTALIVIVVVVLVALVLIYLLAGRGRSVERRPWGHERGAAGAAGREESDARASAEGSQLDARGRDASG